MIRHHDISNNDCNVARDLSLRSHIPGLFLPDSRCLCLTDIARRGSMIPVQQEFAGWRDFEHKHNPNKTHFLRIVIRTIAIVNIY
jgi:hypothetical protein